MLDKIICKESDLAVLVADEIKDEYQEKGYDVDVCTYTSPFVPEDTRRPHGNVWMKNESNGNHLTLYPA